MRHWIFTRRWFGVGARAPDGRGCGRTDADGSGIKSRTGLCLGVRRFNVPILGFVLGLVFILTFEGNRVRSGPDKRAGTAPSKISSLRETILFLDGRPLHLPTNFGRPLGFPQGFSRLRKGKKTVPDDSRDQRRAHDIKWGIQCVPLVRSLCFVKALC